MRGDFCCILWTMQNYSNESPLLPGQKGALLIASMAIKQDRWKDIVQINPRKTLTQKKFQSMFDVCVYSNKFR